VLHKKHFFWVVLLASSITTVFGQTNSATTNISLGISEVSLLKASTGLVSLQLNQRNAGESVETSKSDSTARLLISSVITSSTRTLSAQISSGTVPTGTVLKLAAQQPNANLVGVSGTIQPAVILDNTNKTIVSAISTCYSGTGASDGFPLKFTFALDSNPASYANLRATTNTSITVKLTLSAVQ
jgi:hypothetical protein